MFNNFLFLYLKAQKHSGENVSQIIQLCKSNCLLMTKKKFNLLKYLQKSPCLILSIAILSIGISSIGFSSIALTKFIQNHSFINLGLMVDKCITGRATSVLLRGCQLYN